MTSVLSKISSNISIEQFATPVARAATNGACGAVIGGIMGLKPIPSALLCASYQVIQYIADQAFCYLAKSLNWDTNHKDTLFISRVVIAGASAAASMALTAAITGATLAIFESATLLFLSYAAAKEGRELVDQYYHQEPKKA